MRVDPRSFHVNPDDPRAPSQEVWDAMSEAERAEVLAALPSEFPISEANPPEGDPHFNTKAAVRDVLSRHFRRMKRDFYIACQLPVYYPGEPMFAPDVMVVLDVAPHSRDSWVVDTEKRGLDVALEVHYAGRRAKDVVVNVERYARLGISEYFVYEVRKARLRGYALTPGKRSYQPILPQGGLVPSKVLGLELGVLNDRLRFFSSLAPLPEADELIDRLNAAVDEMSAKKEETERRLDEESYRADVEMRRAEDAERQLARAMEELARLKSKGEPPQ